SNITGNSSKNFLRKKRDSKLPDVWIAGYRFVIMVAPWVTSSLISTMRCTGETGRKRMIFFQVPTIFRNLPVEFVRPHAKQHAFWASTSQRLPSSISRKALLRRRSDADLFGRNLQ